jgi:hypothetical protein
MTNHIIACMVLEPHLVSDLEDYAPDADGLQPAINRALNE